MDRFWSKVEVAGVDECWEWQASTCDGYGKFSVGRGQWDRAHRVSWRLNVGHIPDDKCVLHTCDNRKCVNPKHLYLGTKKNNAEDREARDRGNHATGENNGKLTCPGSGSGEDNGRAKLNESDVSDLLHSYFVHGVKKADLARQYNLSKTNVARIISGKLWPNVVGRVSQSQSL